MRSSAEVRARLEKQVKEVKINRGEIKRIDDDFILECKADGTLVVYEILGSGGGEG